MQLGTRLRYGMLAMLELTRKGSGLPVRAEDIAKAEGISKGYLEGLLATLRRAGLVRAGRGPGGGWVLARPSSRVKPLDVYAALEGPTALVPCVEDRALCPARLPVSLLRPKSAKAPRTKTCRARRLWVSMTRAIEKTLRADTLAALAGVAGRARKKPAAARKKKAAVKSNDGKGRRVKVAARLKSPSSAKSKGRKKKPAVRKSANKKSADRRKAAVVRGREIVKIVRSARLRRSA